MGSKPSKKLPEDFEGKVYAATTKGIPSQKGKVFAITGCTSGTGLVFALTVAHKGGDVIMLNRASSRATTAARKVKVFISDFKTGSKCCQIPCDLQDFESVKSAAAKIKEQFPRGIDVLCNNAGIMMFPDQATKDGYDVQMQTNHLSHFLLTKELFPLLEKKAEAVGEARVVNHSSIAAWMGGPLEEKYLGKNGGKLGGGESTVFDPTNPTLVRYHQSKLANMVFTTAMGDRLKAAGSKVKVSAAHPGVSATGLFKHMEKDVAAFPMQPMADGACGIIVCSMKPDIESVGYYGPAGSKPGENYSGAAVALPFHDLCTDEESKNMLWKASCDVSGPFLGIELCAGESKTEEADD